MKDYAIVLLDPAGTVVSWNAGAERINGYAAGEIVGRHFSRFHTAEDRQPGRPAATLDAAAAEGRCEVEGGGSEGRLAYWANVVVTAVRDRSCC